MTVTLPLGPPVVEGEYLPRSVEVGSLTRPQREALRRLYVGLHERDALLPANARGARRHVDSIADAVRYVFGQIVAELEK